jgi:rod shape-determining protein MreD
MQDRFGFSMGSVFVALVPFSLGVIGAVVANFPVSLGGGLVPAPLFVLMPLYFWCLVRPDLMPPATAFMLGLLEDLLSGGPLGVWAASFVACYAFVDRERDAFAGLASYGAILGFATAVLIAAGTAYGIVAIYYWRFPPPAPLVMTVGVSIFWYIPAVWLMNKIQHRLIGPLRSDF